MSDVPVVNTHEAKTHLSRLIERAAAGEDIVIGRAGKPLVVMSAYRELREPRRPGRWKGRVKVADDFDTTPEEILDAFEGA